MGASFQNLLESLTPEEQLVEDAWLQSHIGFPVCTRLHVCPCGCFSTANTKPSKTHYSSPSLDKCKQDVTWTYRKVLTDSGSVGFPPPLHLAAAPTFIAFISIFPLLRHVSIPWIPTLLISTSVILLASVSKSVQRISLWYLCGKAENLHLLVRECDISLPCMRFCLVWTMSQLYATASYRWSWCAITVGLFSKPWWCIVQRERQVGISVLYHWRRITSHRSIHIHKANACFTARTLIWR